MGWKAWGRLAFALRSGAVQVRAKLAAPRTSQALTRRFYRPLRDPRLIGREVSRTEPIGLAPAPPRCGHAVRSARKWRSAQPRTALRALVRVVFHAAFRQPANRVSTSAVTHLLSEGHCVRCDPVGKCEKLCVPAVITDIGRSITTDRLPNRSRPGHNPPP